MNATSRRTAIIASVITGVVCLAVGAAAAWGVQRSATAELERRVDELTQANEELDATVRALMAASAEETASAEPSDDASTAAESPSSTESAAKPSKEFAFISKATNGSKPTIVADYAQMLTGAAAAAAATADGEESPPPNDYYISNTNTKLRTLKVKKGVKVKLLSQTDGTINTDGYTVPFATWAGYFASPTANNAAIRGVPYWLTIEDGTVTAIEEQYLP